MRKLIATLLLSAAVVGCATKSPDYGERSPEAQRLLAQYLGGKTAGTPQSCIPRYRTDDMVVVDENTILFRDGATRVYRTEMQGGCSGLGRSSRALVSRSFSGSSLCRGEIAQVIDSSTGTMVGSCSYGDFVLYTGPGRG